MTSIRTELAAAIRVVNAAYNRLPTEVQDQVEVAAFDPLEAEVDAACLSDDRERALAAIRAWREHWVAEFERARS